MDISIPEELSLFGVTSEDFEAKKSDLAKSEKVEVKENDVIWEIYKDLLKKALNFEILQMIYWNMAIFKDKLGQNSFEFQQKSHQSRLLHFIHQGKTKVKINATGCSSSCRERHNLILSLPNALKNLPIPNPKCESILNSSNTWCNSIYQVAKDSESESKKPPPPVSKIPKLPELSIFSEENKNNTFTLSGDLKKSRTSQDIKSWALSLLTLFLGFGLFFYSPISSVILMVSSIPVFPPLMKNLSRFFPFLNKKWKRLGILGIGIFLAVLVWLLSLLSERKINTFEGEKDFLFYEILLIEDQSISTRSRLNVIISAPEALNSKDRAKVVMEAAKHIHATEVSNDPNKLKYDYVFVTLEASKNNIGQGYVLAEAEFAPDGGGFLGRLINNESKWKWNVRSSNVLIQPFETKSLQKIKGTLKTFLIR